MNSIEESKDLESNGIGLLQENTIKIKCKYLKFGCNFQVSLDNLEVLKKHYRDSIQNHLALCYSKCEEIQNSFEKLKEEYDEIRQRFDVFDKFKGETQQKQQNIK